MATPATKPLKSPSAKLKNRPLVPNNFPGLFSDPIQFVRHPKKNLFGSKGGKIIDHKHDKSNLHKKQENESPVKKTFKKDSNSPHKQKHKDVSTKTEISLAFKNKSQKNKSDYHDNSPSKKVLSNKIKHVHKKTAVNITKIAPTINHTMKTENQNGLSEFDKKPQADTNGIQVIKTEPFTGEEKDQRTRENTKDGITDDMQPIANINMSQSAEEIPLVQNDILKIKNEINGQDELNDANNHEIDCKIQTVRDSEVSCDIEMPVNNDLIDTDSAHEIVTKNENNLHLLPQKRKNDFEDNFTNKKVKKIDEIKNGFNEANIAEQIIKDKQDQIDHKTTLEMDKIEHAIKPEAEKVEINKKPKMIKQEQNVIRKKKKRYRFKRVAYTQAMPEDVNIVNKFKFSNPAFRDFVYVETCPNGEASTLHAYESQLQQLTPEERQIFAADFCNLCFSETIPNKADFVMGIVHDSAADMPDFVDYLAERHPELLVKVEVLGQRDILTMHTTEFRDKVRDTYSRTSGMYRYVYIRFLPDSYKIGIY